MFGTLLPRGDNGNTDRWLRIGRPVWAEGHGTASPHHSIIIEKHYRLPRSPHNNNNNNNNTRTISKVMHRLAVSRNG